MLDMPENNVFLSKEELDVAIAAIGNALRTPGMSDETYDLLTGVNMELRYARRKLAYSDQRNKEFENNE